MAAYDTVAIVGVGLIGGSIGLALRERQLARQIVGIGRRESSLAAARRVGALDRSSTDLAEGVADAEIVLVCSPVDLIPEMVVRISAACPAEALITDVGSTKAEIVQTIDKALSDRRSGPRFVGSHPLAGDHRSGPQHARADLLDGRIVVMTPSGQTARSAVVEATGLWQNLGARVVEMTPAAHDAALAATSHVPHLLAAALAAATPQESLPLAAGGWQDTTRVAGSDPRLWQAIFATNRPHVLEALRRVTNELGKFQRALEQSDDERLMKLLEAARRVKADRDALGD